MARGTQTWLLPKLGGAPLDIERQPWAMADGLRGHMEAAECKHVALGLIFPKYISDAFLTDLKGRIQAAQVRAALAVNSELVLLYWQIGRGVLERQEREGWGAKVIDRLSADLRRAFPEMKGFSSRNLKYMRAFAQAWPDEPFVQEVLAQIT